MKPQPLQLIGCLLLFCLIGAAGWAASCFFAKSEDSLPHAVSKKAIAMIIIRIPRVFLIKATSLRLNNGSNF